MYIHNTTTPTPLLQKVTDVLQQVAFGTITFRIADGRLSAEPEICYTGKPRSHLPQRNRDSTAQRPPTFGEAIQDLFREIGELKGALDVTVEVADRIPLRWKLKPIGPLQGS